MSQIERYRDRRGSFRTKPLVPQETKRFERDTFGRQFVIELLNERFELSACNFNSQIADAHLQQLVITLSVEVGRGGRSRGARFSRLFIRVVHRAPFNSQYSRRCYDALDLLYSAISPIG